VRHRRHQIKPNCSDIYFGKWRTYDESQATAKSRESLNYFDGVEDEAVRLALREKLGITPTEITLSVCPRCLMVGDSCALGAAHVFAAQLYPYDKNLSHRIDITQMAG
jgi:hypothetical protein